MESITPHTRQIHTQHPNKFPKANRLLLSSDFDSTFTHVQKRLYCDIAVLLATPNKHSMPRLGLITPKKKIPLAKNRNTFKRIVKEVFRKNKNDISNMDIIILAKVNKGKIIKKDIAKQIEALVLNLSEDKKNG